MQVEASVTEFLYCPGTTGLKNINISILCYVPVMDSVFPWPLELLGHLTQGFMWRLHLSCLSLNQHSEHSLLMVSTHNFIVLTVDGAA